MGSHAYVIKKGQRFIINSAIASMGYDLPAAIGACGLANRMIPIIIDNKYLNRHLMMNDRL